MTDNSGPGHPIAAESAEIAHAFWLRTQQELKEREAKDSAEKTLVESEELNEATNKSAR